jgi:hypothetical protein
MMISIHMSQWANASWACKRRPENTTMENEEASTTLGFIPVSLVTVWQRRGNLRYDHDEQCPE